MRNLLIQLIIISALCCFGNIYAAADDSPCWNKYNGRCQWRGSEPCGWYDDDPLCGGPDKRQCCVIGADRLCHIKYPNGRCQNYRLPCAGRYNSANLCGGDRERQCCTSLYISRNQ
ncbi:uncharacterized protein LOC111132173 [Crassostrea virginica]